jgi:GntP family gluconate:H+ symporter
MPLLHSLYLAVATLAIAASTARGRMHPFIAVVLGAACFAFASGMSISQLGKSFGAGFGQTVNTLGLPVLAAAAVTAIAERRPGTTWPMSLGSRWIALLGLFAGTGASPAAAFAVLSPLRGGCRRALTLGLGISAGQALLLPSPVVIAATAIIAADWHFVLVFGLPLGLLTAGAGAVLASAAAPAEPALPLPTPIAAKRRPVALFAACLAMTVLLIVQSLGDMPSEPFGGGSARELILGVGRPLIVLLAGIFIMAACTGAWRGEAISESGWAAASVTRAAPLMLLLGAAGGLQSLTQTAHMAEMVTERLLPLPWGLALPFLAAAVMKILQGSSLVAAITAAGMIQPLLTSLGLDGETGRALAVLAVGAGAMTVPHVNDGFFWIVADEAGLRPARALQRFTCLALTQGVFALAALFAIRAVG